MDEFVIDTSALIQAFVNDEHMPNALELMRQAYAEDSTIRLHVIDFTLSECLNIIWKRVRFHGLPIDEAIAVAEALYESPLTVHSQLGIFRETLRIGVDHQQAVYDSMYLALALDLGLPLITDDRRQAAAATQLGVTLKPITDFPPLQLD